MTLLSLVTVTPWQSCNQTKQRWPLEFLRSAILKLLFLLEPPTRDIHNIFKPFASEVKSRVDIAKIGCHG